MAVKNEAGNVSVQEIPIKQVVIVENHRTNISATNINELMLSIKQHGLKQPIGVTPMKGGKYSLIFGNRRLMACEKLGWVKIPAIVTNDVDEKNHLILNLTENIQRNDPSFVEMGRLIEKLKKMDMTHAEISARLGIDEKRVKQIAHVYNELPEKHRSKVVHPGKGGKNTKGTIRPHVATQVIHIKKDFGLSEKDTDNLIKYITDTDMSREDILNLAILLKAGLKIDDAIEKLHEYHVYHIDVVSHRLLTSKAMAEANCVSANTFFKKIIYGQIKCIQKPDFITV